MKAQKKDAWMNSEKIDSKKYPREYIPDPGFNNRASIYLDGITERSFSGSLQEAYIKGRDIESLIQKLQKIKAKFDKKYETAYLFKSRVYYEGEDASFYFASVRPETDEEYALRVQKNKQAELDQENQARAQYEQLKKRFGNE